MLEMICRPMRGSRTLAFAFSQLVCLGCSASVVLEDEGTGGGGNGSTTSSGVTTSSKSSSSTGLFYSEDETNSRLECHSHEPRLFVEIYPGEFNGGCFIPNIPGQTILVSIAPWDGLAGTYPIDDEDVVVSMPDLQSVSGGTLTVSVSAVVADRGRLGSRRSLRLRLRRCEARRLLGDDRHEPVPVETQRLRARSRIRRNAVSAPPPGGPL